MSRREISPRGLSTSMTLLILVMSAPSNWYVRIPLAVTGVAGIILPSLVSRPSFWLVPAVVMLMSNALAWHSADNHKHLLFYWLVALFLASFRSAASSVLARAARWLLVATFGFATFWKVYNVEFREGAFFHYTLLLDQRFQVVSELLCGLTERDYKQNAQLFAQLRQSFDGIPHAELVSNAQVINVAMGMTWWTVIIEMSLALLFWLPKRYVGTLTRHLALITFVLTTYAIAPVLGFGYILLAMGVAQVEPTRRWLLLTYASAFLAVVMYATPWKTIGNYAIGAY